VTAAALLRRLGTPAAVGVVLALGLGGAAYASYRSAVAATGTGSAVTSATQTVTLTVTGAVSTGLYPGGPGASVTVQVANPYARPISITSISGGTPVVTGGTGPCTTTGIAFAQPSSGLPLAVPANGSASVSLPGVVTMGTNADSGCQGASFAIAFTVTGTL
jgi:hypothetical protein